MKFKKLNESSLVDKKVSTLGKNGKPMYFTDDQLKDAKAKYPEYDFEETTVEYSLPQGQKAYTAKKRANESKSIKVFGAKAKKLNESVREYTNKLLDMVDEGIVDKDILIRGLLNYMSEDEVKDFVITNEYDD